MNLTRGQANGIYISILFLVLLGIYIAYIIDQSEISVAKMASDLEDSKLALSSVIVLAAGLLGLSVMNFFVEFKN